MLEKDFPELELDLLTPIDMSTEKLLDTLMGYSREVGIIYNSWFVGKKQSESRYLADNLQKIIYGFVDAPVFTLTEMDVETGAFAGGYFISALDFGKVTIQAIRQILGGVPARDVEGKIGGKPKVYLIVSLEMSCFIRSRLIFSSSIRSILLSVWHLLFYWERSV